MTQRRRGDCLAVDRSLHPGGDRVGAVRLDRHRDGDRPATGGHCLCVDGRAVHGDLHRLLALAGRDQTDVERVPAVKAELLDVPRQGVGDTSDRPGEGLAVAVAVLHHELHRVRGAGREVGLCLEGEVALGDRRHADAGVVDVPVLRQAARGIPALLVQADGSTEDLTRCRRVGDAERPGRQPVCDGDLGAEAGAAAGTSTDERRIHDVLAI